MWWASDAWRLRIIRESDSRRIDGTKRNIESVRLSRSERQDRGDGGVGSRRDDRDAYLGELLGALLQVLLGQSLNQLTDLSQRNRERVKVHVPSRGLNFPSWGQPRKVYLWGARQKARGRKLRRRVGVGVAQAEAGARRRPAEPHPTARARRPATIQHRTDATKHARSLVPFRPRPRFGIALLTTHLSLRPIRMIAKLLSMVKTILMTKNYKQKLQTFLFYKYIVHELFRFFFILHIILISVAVCDNRNR